MNNPEPDVRQDAGDGPATGYPGASPGPPLAWLDGELTALQSQNRLRSLRVRESPHVSGLLQLDGNRLVDFGSNDYLGIAADSRLVEAVRRAVGEHGWGSGASPLVSGYGVLHRRLEEELARFEEVAAVCLFPTGFAANVAAVSSLCGPGDVIFSDQLNHASIVDGCRLSRAEVVVYQHLHTASLGELLQQRSRFRRALIVTDSLFSMDGDFAPLQQLAELARRHDCMLMVDEAHATGVWGENGRGVAELKGVENSVDIRVGTLSKALGSIGGFVAGSRALVDWIRNRGRSYMFSTAIPEAAAAASLAALDIVRSEPARRVRLRELIALLPKLVERTRRPTAPGLAAIPSQIVPWLVGGESQTLRISKSLHDSGFFVPAIRPPAVPPNACRLRISLSSAHSDLQVQRLAECLNRIGPEFGPH